MSQRNFVTRTVTLALLSVVLPGCAGFVPTVGPSRTAASARKKIGIAQVQVVDVNDAVTRKLLTLKEQRLFSETLQSQPAATRRVGAGDLLEVSIWEAMPATLFGAGVKGLSGISTSQATTLPDQMVNDEGFIDVPFAGKIQAAGLTVSEIQAEIVRRLTGKANQPQVLVRMTLNSSSNATVVGEVNKSTRVPLVPGNERLLDALAAAGGVRQPVDKTTIQVTRSNSVYALPLETVIRDPLQNVKLLPGDVVTALYQPYSFIALGATGKNEEINFETQGISLAQALGRAGGLVDQRSNARGAFIFRLEPKNAIDWPDQPVKATPEGLVPVVYRFDLKDPSSFFVMQSFPIENHDVLYVSNAPANELQKFLNLIFTVAYPILTAKQVGF